MFLIFLHIKITLTLRRANLTQNWRIEEQRQIWLSRFIKSYFISYNIEEVAL